MCAEQPARHWESQTLVRCRRASKNHEITYEGRKTAQAVLGVLCGAGCSARRKHVYQGALQVITAIPKVTLQPDLTSTLNLD